VCYNVSNSKEKLVEVSFLLDRLNSKMKSIRVYKKVTVGLIVFALIFGMFGFFGHTEINAQAAEISNPAIVITGNINQHTELIRQHENFSDKTASCVRN
jgi:hypothetical protein